MKMMITSSILALGLLGNAQTQAAYIHYEPYEPFNYQTTRTTLDEITRAFTVGSAIVIGAGLTYLAGRGLGSRALNNAKEFFADQLGLMSNRMYFEETLFASSLKKTILNTSESYFNSWWRFGAYEEYRNYPLLFFKKRLDQSITSVRILGLFHAGTSKYEEIQNTLSQLQSIATFLQTDYEFIKERRRFEERVQPHYPAAPQAPTTNVNVNVSLR